MAEVDVRARGVSLINQMLQDLDRRRASDAERGALPNHIRVLPQARRPRVLAVTGALVGAAALASALAWGYSHRSSALESVAQEAPRGAAVQASTPQVVHEPTRAAEPAPAAAAELPPPPRRARRTERERRSQNEAGDPAVVPTLVFSTALATPPAERPRAAERAQPQQAPDAADGASTARPEIEKRAREPSARDAAENDFRSGANLLSSGRAAEAQERFRSALQHNPAHAGARQALFGLLLNARRPDEAERVLQDGLRLNVRQPGFAMALARLQVERGDVAAGIETLQKSAAAAGANADYLAFLAALLQRQERHAEAVEHYHAALSLAPTAAVWQMGLGISLQALNRTAEAQDAFRRARSGSGLNPELQAFVDERLRQLARR